MYEKGECMFDGIIEFPALKEWWDIALVALLGLALWRTQKQIDLFEGHEAVGKSLIVACFVYSGSQLLSNHAEAQGVMLSVL